MNTRTHLQPSRLFFFNALFLLFSFPIFSQTVLIDSLPLAIAGNNSYIWGEANCNLTTGIQTLNINLTVDPDCYSSMAIEVYMASDGNLDWSGGSGGHDQVDMEVTVGGTPTHIANQNPDYCSTGNFNSAVTLSGESSCNCDWGQLTQHCSGGWPDCAGAVQPSPLLISQTVVSSTTMSVKFDYRVTNSAGGTCEDPCDEVIQVQYVLIKGVQQGCSSLPVELISFNAKNEREKAMLDWKAVEIDFDRYEIEMSTSGFDWNKVQAVYSKGGAGENIYHVSLDMPTAELVYFRLKMIDKDGSYEYSNVRNVKGANIDGHIVIAPNPVSDILYVSMDASGHTETKLQIYNVNGGLVKEQTLYGNVERVGVSDLKRGIYFMRLFDETGFNVTKRFVK